MKGLTFKYCKHVILYILLCRLKELLRKLIQINLITLFIFKFNLGHKIFRLKFASQIFVSILQHNTALALSHMSASIVINLKNDNASILSILTLTLEAYVQIGKNWNRAETTFKLLFKGTDLKLALGLLRQYLTS